VKCAQYTPFNLHLFILNLTFPNPAKMNYVRLTGNNGSVIGSDFIRFQLEIKENGQAQLTIKKGRDKEAEILAGESKIVSTDKIRELTDKAKFLSTEPEDNVMVGGPEKIIGVKDGERRITFTVTEDNPKANDFYIECLNLFDSGLNEKLDKIIYF
jgi:hypothetical protein